MAYNIRWYDTYYFYVFTFPNGLKKMGITFDLKSRRSNNSFRYGLKIEKFDYVDQVDTGWQAYLFEQVVKFRCERFTLKQKTELFYPEIPIEMIIQSYKETKLILSRDLNRYQSIHLISPNKDRKKEYQKIAISLGAYLGKIDRNFEDYL